MHTYELQRGFGNMAIIALIAVVLIGGGAYYFTSQNAASGGLMLSEEARMQMEKEGTLMEQDDVMMEKDEAMIGGDAMMEKDDAMMIDKEDGETMMRDDGVMMEKSGSYEVYSAEKLARANSGDVVLFFRASWCPTCRQIDSDIRAHLKDIPAGVTILDVNYDTAEDLKRKYNVTYQHTFVQVDAEGNQLAKWSGSPTLAALLTNIK